MSQSACFSGKILCVVILIGNRVRVKSSGLAPGLANARPPGSATFANAFFIEIHALSDLFISNCKLFDSFHYNVMMRGISDLTKWNYTIIRMLHKTYHGRFGFNKNSALKFRKFHVPNGTVHSDCTDPTQATARLVIVLVSRMQKRGAGDNNFVKLKGTFRSDRRNDQAGKGGPSKVVPNIPSDRTEIQSTLS